MSKVFKDRTAAMNPARILLTPHPMGRPLSAPHDVEKQRDILMHGLRLLDSATEGGTIVEYDKPYRSGPFCN
ncbi:MAG TPA: hypothetical protein DHV68_06390 [Dehalococcoidia bacterium]|nr:hypothetical protein [Chloroflexota bacterium]HCI86457.1 hypothetical protein [Dehalococcoidia bacterium]